MFRKMKNWWLKRQERKLLLSKLSKVTRLESVDDIRRKLDTLDERYR